MFSGLQAKYIAFVLVFAVFFHSCGPREVAKEKEIVETPEKIDAHIADNISAILDYASENMGRMTDSENLLQYNILDRYYRKKDFTNSWSRKGAFLPVADSLFYFVKNARGYGLYPEDYHLANLDSLFVTLQTDSLEVRDAVAWAKADLLLSDAFIQLLLDLKQGRLLPDSLSNVHDDRIIDSFYIKRLEDAINTSSVYEIFDEVQPDFPDYRNLIRALRKFTDTMDVRRYETLEYPFKDSLFFIKSVYKRLIQCGFGNASVALPDSFEYTTALKEYQVARSLKPDGVAGPAVVRALNTTDQSRFLQVAITLDRYKLAERYPPVFILVNIPSFYLKVVADGEEIMRSKVVVGKPSTETPVLTSMISNMVTYPQWTVPASIIRKDILPQLKQDAGYLERKGFSLVDDLGQTIDPFTVDWSKYDKWIPWRVVQGSGDDNALGVFKFNFNNPYSVYLHDTNQRYLFANTNRALSHGCVRVEKWQELAAFITDQDHRDLAESESRGYNTDSIDIWISNKSRKQIMIKNRTPLLIRYFTCEARDGKILFYQDIYGSDKKLARIYFPNK